MERNLRDEYEKDSMDDFTEFLNHLVRMKKNSQRCIFWIRRFFVKLTVTPRFRYHNATY